MVVNIVTPCNDCPVKIYLDARSSGRLQKSIKYEIVFLRIIFDGDGVDGDV